MTEDQAITWLKGRLVSDTIEALQRYVAMLRTAATEQNLVSASTLPHIWARHIVDSLQLLSLAPNRSLRWLDIGSGAGLPGLVIAIASEHKVTLVEPRKLRADFLQYCITDLALADHTTLVRGKVETMDRDRFAVISARAVAKLPDLFAAAHHLTDPDTLWVLPKGRDAEREVADVARSWHGTFHVKPSVVDPASGIVIGKGVHKR